MPPVHGVTVSLNVSPEIDDLTKKIAHRFAVINNMPVTIIQDADLSGITLSHSHFARYHMWDILPKDVQKVVYFDVDILPMRPLPKLPGADFAAAPESPHHISEACKLWPLFKESGFYFNSGVFVASRSTDLVFKRVLDKQTHAGNGKWPWIIDQTLFNIEMQAAVKNGEITIEQLPREWNSLVVLDQKSEVPEPYMLHFAAMGIGHPSKVKLVSKLVDCINGIERTTGYTHGGA